MSEIHPSCDFVSFGVNKFATPQDLGREWVRVRISGEVMPQDFQRIGVEVIPSAIRLPMAA
jgi:hypothetical protein